MPYRNKRDDNDDLTVLNEYNPEISGTARDIGAPGDVDEPSAIEEEQIRTGDMPGEEQEGTDEVDDAD